MLNERPEGKAYPTWPMGMPVHRSAGQWNHAVRRGSVCDSTYRRIQERTMMVDYSDWLNSLPRNSI